MLMPKRRASTVAAKSSSSSATAAGGGNANPQAVKKAAVVNALFDLEAYLKNRDYVGALTLMGLKLQQQRGDSGTNDGTTDEDGREQWRVNTWWLAYCHFQCGNFSGALDYFDQLLASQDQSQGQIEAHTGSSSSHGADEESWRLSRACCLYYLQNFEDAEQAALSSKRHALCNRLLYLIAHRRKYGEKVLLDRYQQLSSSCPEDLLALAFTSFAQRNFQESIEIYKQLLQQSKKSDELGAVHVYLAMCYFKSDYYDVSLELLAVYLASHTDSFFANNLKACNQYKLYSGYEAGQVLDEFRLKFPKHSCAQRGGGDVYDSMGIREVAAHNTVVFQEAGATATRTESLGSSSASGAAVATLKSLVDVIDEAKMNLVLCHLQYREYEKAFELVDDLEPVTPSEHLIKGILHGVIGEETNSKEHVFLAEKHFHVRLTVAHSFSLMYESLD